MTEAELQKALIELGHICGWYIAHFRPARTKHGWVTPVTANGKGFPDLVLVRPPRVIFAEIKSEKGKLTLEQETWLDLLKSSKGEVYIWRPKDLDDIVEILR